MNATFLDTYGFGRRKPPQQENICFIELKLATVRTKVVGAGNKTLIIVPDPPNVIEHYDNLISKLSDQYRVVCFEAPGFGFSFPKRGFQFTFSQQKEIVIELLEKLKIQSAILSFSCIGAFVALMIAETRPDLVSRLILNQIPSYVEAQNWTCRKDLFNIIKTPVVGQIALKLGKNIVAKTWYKSAIPQTNQVNTYLQPTLDSFHKGACFCLASAFQTFQKSSKFDFSSLKQETIVLWGGADKSHEDTDKKSVLVHIPHANWIEFPDCGHFPDLENPKEYINLLNS